MKQNDTWLESREIVAIFIKDKLERGNADEVRFDIVHSLRSKQTNPPIIAKFSHARIDRMYLHKQS